MGNNLQKTILYCTLNLVNHKIYIGAHDCNPDVYDSYLGEGCYANKPSSYMKKTVPFARALQKYGPDKFYRMTLGVFNSRKKALALERIIVNQDFIKRTDVYNITIGGGDPPRSDVSFYRYDLKGNLIEECKNMRKTCEQLGLSHDRILNAIKEKRSCANSFWSYDKHDKLDVTNYTFTNRGYICQYNKNGDLLNEFKSVQEAANKLDISENMISNSLFRRSCSTGYYFLRSHENFTQTIINKQVEKYIFYRYDVYGDLIKEYNDFGEALREIPKSTLSGLKRAIFKEKDYKGSYWSIEKYINFFKRETAKKVAQLSDNGEIVKIWNSISECKRQFPNVVKVLAGKYTQSKGFKFKIVS